MGRCSIQIVMGPAGSGKSTYCKAMQEHAEATSGANRRRIHVANLDPAAEVFQYEPLFDVRELISVPEVMQELQLGPNGALVYSMEYMLENLDWLRDALDDLDDDEYIILDCPGQLELYTHVPIMKSVLDSLKLWGYDGHMVSVFCVDAAFLVDLPKFLSGSLLALSAMVALELPHINVLTKADLMPANDIESILSQSATQLWHQEQDRLYTNHERNNQNNNATNASEDGATPLPPRKPRKDERLTDALCQLLEDYSMVSFIPLNIQDEDSIQHVLATADHAIQYGEDLEVRAAEGNDLEENE
mmetsp:Transcript_23027/g.48033  ORF Transcript_23027/g.48033 Transcript_23027/m.48033 type:complete len:303 (-) Transcript_23027:28-936(-)|eukprot:CAMPEP_0172465468 /NCGR_PEP_ID=MMETSP1065-20121228/53596_1 /TAXON_ID=265537 /ORGANISM="Amphiprora paludosa, Strain CCMP125" /LENGTH=302 /DNA_ID=CAMNT_0013221999 /DNA_START=24 /DNA_END=932 /DNA_ORIENTATION=+